MVWKHPAKPGKKKKEKKKKKTKKRENLMAVVKKNTPRKSWEEKTISTNQKKNFLFTLRANFLKKILL